MRLINADALAKKLEKAIKIGKSINKPTEELEATLDYVNHMTTAQVDLYEFERMTDKNFESCFECIHSDDSEDMCILRQCIHVVGAFKECYEPKQPEQPKVIHCRDCCYWIPGLITDNDCFIPPKCGKNQRGKYQQIVGHFADDYCSYAERREVSSEDE